MENPQISLLNANTLELHYWFNDQTHTMDVVVQNKCERELLAIIEEIAKIFDAEVLIETMPLAEGGIIRWFKLFLKKGKKQVIITALVTALATGVIITPIGTSLSEIGKQLIEKIFEDGEIKELKKELLKENLKNLEEDVETKNLEQKKIEEEIKNLRLDAGLPIPQFSPDGSDFWVIFRKDIYNKEDLSKLGLNKRQIDALVYFKSKGEITSSEYAERYKVTDRTARNDLSELEVKEILIKQGGTKLAKYVFKE